MDHGNAMRARKEIDKGWDDTDDAKESAMEYAAIEKTMQVSCDNALNQALRAIERVRATREGEDFQGAMQIVREIKSESEQIKFLAEIAKILAEKESGGD